MEMNEKRSNLSWNLYSRFSSDGDPRLLNAMKNIPIYRYPDLSLEWQGWFFESLNQSEMYIQDMTHVGKLRNKFLKPSYVMPLGNFMASSMHLRILIAEKGKEEHGLIMTDINNKDKMNFRLKISVSFDLDSVCEDFTHNAINSRKMLLQLNEFI